MTDGPLEPGQQLRCRQGVFTSSDNRAIVVMILKKPGGMEAAKADQALLDEVNKTRPPNQQVTMKQLRTKFYDLKSGYMNNTGPFSPPELRIKGDPGLYHVKQQHLKNLNFERMQQQGNQQPRV